MALLAPSACGATDHRDGSQPAEPPDASPDSAPRSTLYPEDWTPGFADANGHALPDVSYAGYRNGEAQPNTSSYAVVTPPIVADGVTDNTSVLQAAIDNAPLAGAVIMLPAGEIRMEGTIAVRRSKLVLRGAGAATRLRFTKTSGMSDQSHLAVGVGTATTLETNLIASGVAGAHTIDVASGEGFAVDDDILVGWTITPAFIETHGMTGVWKAFNGTWQPFFRRRIVAMAPVAGGVRLTLDVPLRYDALLRDSASVRREVGAISQVGIEQLSLTNAVPKNVADDTNRPMLISFYGVQDAWIDGVSSYAPGAIGEAEAEVWSRGIVVANSKRVTISDTHLAFAQHRGDGGNGYLFEITASNEVLIVDCTARRGRHNFIQNWGFGATGLVFLRVHSRESTAINSGFELGAASEFHHSLAMANAIDQSIIDDGWHAENRGDYSSGAGLTATQTVFWNNRGEGIIRSYQAGVGYLIGNVLTGLTTALPSPWPSWGLRSEPEDFVELAGSEVSPPSLYEDQLARRLARGERLWP
ncbi:MAG: hypothetical protein IPL79_05280 [Myxococcales bacterium]|nr:hypothetical protein [Myxococcales bacterium]